MTDLFYYNNYNRINIILCIIRSPPHAELTLGLETGEYSVVEGGSVPVCVSLLSGVAQRQVTFTLMSGGGSASGT